MSSALVRQALEFVDQEESGGKRGKRRGASRRKNLGQEHPQHHPYKQKPKSKSKQPESGRSQRSDQTIEDNVRKLLALSAPTADKATADKIVERAVKGRPLLEKIEVKKEEYKSILFPDEEPFTKFEKEAFCS